MSLHAPRWVLAAFALVASIAYSSASFSQESSPLVQQAQALAEQGNLSGAIDLLESNRPLGRPETLALGTAYIQVGRFEDAVRTLTPAAKGTDATAEELFAAGLASKGLGDPRQALEYLSRSSRLAPTSPASRELGILLGSLGENEAAYPLLVDWASKNPSDSGVRLLAALAATALERLDEAESLLGSLDTNDPRVRLLRGKIAAGRNDLPEAIRLLEPLAVNPSPELASDLRQTLARAYLDTQQPQKAIDLLEGWVGDDVALAMTLSDAFEAAGYPESAASALRRFIEPIVERTDEMPPELAANGAAMARRYGELTLKAEQPEEALTYLEVAVQLAPQDTGSWALLAEALDALGRSEDADAARARGAGQGADAADDATGQAIAEALVLARTRLDEALVALHEIHEQSTDDPRPSLVASRLLLAQGRGADALAAVELALQAAPLEAAVLHQKGAVLRLVGEPQKAEEIFRQILDAAPDHVPTLNEYAALLIDRGDLEQANFLLQQALEVAPDDPATKFNLERASAASGG